mgnify:FL=1
MTQVPNEVTTPATVTGATAPEASERPDNVPEKFWNAETKSVNTEALLASYSELEKERSKGAQKPAETPTETPAEETPSEETPSAEEAGEFGKYFTEYAEKGEVSAESREELAKLGISGEMVDAYIKGATADATAAVTSSNEAILAEVGGKEKFDAISEWAKTNADPETLKLFNEAAAAGEATKAKLAIAAINAAYVKANGTTASKRVTGEQVPASGAGYDSHAQYMADMNNPQYKSDPAFREKVAARLAVTTAF